MGDPPSSKSEFTTGFPASKYMYKLVFTLYETFTRPLHEAIFTPTACCRRALTPCASEQSSSVQGRRQPSGVPVTPSSASIMKPAVMADRHEVGGQSHDPIFDDVALLDIYHCTR